MSSPAGFARKPFAPTPAPEFWVHTQTAHAAFEELLDCLQSARGIAVLTAPAGLGKTLLCCRLVDALKDRFRVLLFPGGGMETPAAFLQEVLCDLDRPYRGMTEQELRLQLKRSVREVAGHTEGLVMILDEAHRLGEAVLEEFRAATNLIENGQPIVRGLLSGQFPLEEKLTSSRLDALNQRIGCHVYLEPLARDESARYIRERLEQAGLHPADVFTPEAVRMICHAAGGNPRCLNRLCDRAVMLAERIGTRPVNQTLVRNALDDLKQLPLHWNEPWPDEADTVVPREPQDVETSTATASAEEGSGDPFSATHSTPTHSTPTHSTPSAPRADDVANHVATRTADTESTDNPSAVIEVGAEASANLDTPTDSDAESVPENAVEIGEVYEDEPQTDDQRTTGLQSSVEQAADSQTRGEQIDDGQVRNDQSREHHAEQSAGRPSFHETQWNEDEQPSRRPGDTPIANAPTTEESEAEYDMPAASSSAAPPAFSVPGNPVPDNVADWQVVELRHPLKRDAVNDVPAICFGEQSHPPRDEVGDDFADTMTMGTCETATSLPTVETGIDDHYAQLRDEQNRAQQRTSYPAGHLVQGYTATVGGKTPKSSETSGTSFSDHLLPPASQPSPPQTGDSEVPDCDSLLAADGMMRPGPDEVVDSVIAALGHATADHHSPRNDSLQADEGPAAESEIGHIPQDAPGDADGSATTGCRSESPPQQESHTTDKENTQPEAHQADDGSAQHVGGKQPCHEGNEVAQHLSPSPAGPPRETRHSESRPPQSKPPVSWPFPEADAGEYDVVLPEDELPSKSANSLSDLWGHTDEPGDAPADEGDFWFRYGVCGETSPTRRPQNDLFTRLRQIEDDESPE